MVDENTAAPAPAGTETPVTVGSDPTPAPETSTAAQAEPVKLSLVERVEALLAELETAAEDEVLAAKDALKRLLSL